MLDIQNIWLKHINKPVNYRLQQSFVQVVIYYREEDLEFDFLYKGTYLQAKKGLRKQSAVCGNLSTGFSDKKLQF